MTTPAPATPARRPAGRPKVIEDVARLWLRVPADVKTAATKRAEEDGQDLTTAIRELVAAYSEGRVKITKRPVR